MVGDHQIVQSDSKSLVAGETVVKVHRSCVSSLTSMVTSASVTEPYAPGTQTSAAPVSLGPSVFVSVVEAIPHRGKTLKLPPAVGRNLDGSNVAVVVHEARLHSAGQRSSELLLSAAPMVVPSQVHPIQILSALQLTPRLISKGVRVWPKQHQRYYMKGLPLTADHQDKLIEIVTQFMKAQAYGDLGDLLLPTDVVQTCEVIKCLRDVECIECCCRSVSCGYDAFRLTDKGLSAIDHWHVAGPARAFCPIPQNPISRQAVLDLDPLQLVVMLDHQGWSHQHMNTKKKVPALVWPFLDEQKVWYTKFKEDQLPSLQVKYLQCLLLAEDGSVLMHIVISSWIASGIEVRAETCVAAAGVLLVATFPFR